MLPTAGAHPKEPESLQYTAVLRTPIRKVGTYLYTRLLLILNKFRKKKQKNRTVNFRT